MRSSTLCGHLQIRLHKLRWYTGGSYPKTYKQTPSSLSTKETSPIPVSPQGSLSFSHLAKYLTSAMYLLSAMGCTNGRSQNRPGPFPHRTYSFVIRPSTSKNCPARHSLKYQHIEIYCGATWKCWHVHTVANKAG